MTNVMLSSKAHHVPWDPGGSQLVLCIVQWQSEVRRKRNKLKGRSDICGSWRTKQRNLSGFRAAAWGQAAWRNVTVLVGCSPERTWVVAVQSREYKRETTVHRKRINHLSEHKYIFFGKSSWHSSAVHLPSLDSSDSCLYLDPLACFDIPEL